MREGWKFQFSAEELLEALEKKLNYHRGRLEHWTARVDQAEAALKAGGVELREEAYTGGKDIKAVLDPEKSERFQTAKRKVEKHEGRILTLARWGRALEKKAGETLELTIDDIEFFGL